MRPWSAPGGSYHCWPCALRPDSFQSGICKDKHLTPQKCIWITTIKFNHHPKRNTQEHIWTNWRQVTVRWQNVKWAFPFNVFWRTSFCVFVHLVDDIYPKRLTILTNYKAEDCSGVRHLFPGGLKEGFIRATHTISSKDPNNNNHPTLQNSNCKNSS